MVAYMFIGQPIARIEDAALLTGAGRFVDDVPVRDAREAAFVRSSHAHARIKSVDVAAARAAPGVHTVLTYADIRPLLTQDRMPLELRVESLPETSRPIRSPRTRSSSPEPATRTDRQDYDGPRFCTWSSSPTSSAQPRMTASIWLLHRPVTDGRI